MSDLKKIRKRENSKNRYAPVAQLDRAMPSGGIGREFESRRVRHLHRF